MAILLVLMISIHWNCSTVPYFRPAQIMNTICTYVQFVTRHRTTITISDICCIAYHHRACVLHMHIRQACCRYDVLYTYVCICCCSSSGHSYVTWSTLQEMLHLLPSVFGCSLVWLFVLLGVLMAIRPSYHINPYHTLCIDNKTKDD